MLLNLIVFKFVQGIFKCLDLWWMSFFKKIFSCKFIFIWTIYIYIYIEREREIDIDTDLDIDIDIIYIYIYIYYIICIDR